MYEAQVRKVEATMKEAQAEGVRGGLTVSQIAIRAGMLAAQVSHGVAHCGSIVCHRRDGQKFWYLMEDAPYPLLGMAREAIMHRVEGCNQAKRFFITLRKFMNKRADPEISDSGVLAVATDNDVRKAYGMFGPLPSPEELESTREALIGAAQPVDDTARASGDGEWPFKISRIEAKRQQAKLSGRTCTVEKEIEWVKDNLDNDHATPELAPSNYAWKQLFLARQSLRHLDKFNDRVTEFEKLRKKQREVEQKLIDDGRRHFKLLDAAERERAKLKAGAA